MKLMLQRRDGTTFLEVAIPQDTPPLIWFEFNNSHNFGLTPIRNWRLIKNAGAVAVYSWLLGPEPPAASENPPP